MGGFGSAGLIGRPRRELHLALRVCTQNACSATFLCRVLRKFELLKAMQCCGCMGLIPHRPIGLRQDLLQGCVVRSFSFCNLEIEERLCGLAGSEQEASSLGVCLRQGGALREGRVELL